MIPETPLIVKISDKHSAKIHRGRYISFVGGGMMGDFLHTMYAVKHICKRFNAKAWIWLSPGHGGDIWKLGVDKAYNDLKQLIEAQPYVDSFSIMSGSQELMAGTVNLNDWRQMVATTHVTTGKYDKCWTDVLCEEYGIVAPSVKEYAWMELDEDKYSKDVNTQNTITIHRSKHRHNNNFPWEKIMNFSSQKYPEVKLKFVTCDPTEYEAFPYQTPNLELYHVNDIYQMANAIRSSEFFIGNMSTPLVLASAFDIPRVAELDHDPAPFYVTETKYTRNLEYYLSDSCFTQEYAEIMNFLEHIKP